MKNRLLSACAGVLFAVFPVAALAAHTYSPTSGITQTTTFTWAVDDCGTYKLAFYAPDGSFAGETASSGDGSAAWNTLATSTSVIGTYHVGCRNAADSWTTFLSECSPSGTNTYTACFVNTHSGNDVAALGVSNAATSLEATSSVDQTEQNAWYAFYAFFLAFGLVLWLGRSSRV